MARMRVCSAPGCPEIQEATRCTDHTRQVEQARGTRQQRGYDRAHERLRKQHAPKVDAGLAKCARCHLPILPGQAWALDHTDDRAGYLGPSHATCNNAAGGRAAHGG